MCKRTASPGYSKHGLASSRSTPDKGGNVLTPSWALGGHRSMPFVGKHKAAAAAAVLLCSPAVPTRLPEIESHELDEQTRARRGHARLQMFGFSFSYNTYNLLIWRRCPTQTPSHLQTTSVLCTTVTATYCCGDVTATLSCWISSKQ